jgi:hypothetical protein
LDRCNGCGRVDGWLVEWVVGSRRRQWRWLIFNGQLRCSFKLLKWQLRRPSKHPRVRSQDPLYERLNLLQSSSLRETRHLHEFTSCSHELDAYIFVVLVHQGDSRLQVQSFAKQCKKRTLLPNTIGITALVEVINRNPFICAGACDSCVLSQVYDECSCGALNCFC